MPKPFNITDSLVDHEAVLALIVNSGFYRHQTLRKSLYAVFCEQGNERNWDALTHTTWDVLFFLIEKYITGETPGVTDMPHAVGLSTSTARRLLRKLECYDLAITYTDKTDKRRVISELAPVYRPVIDAFIAGYANGFAPLIQQHDKKERRVAQQALEWTREELMDNEALLIQAQKLASLGNWVWDDITMRYISASEEVARIHGISLKEFMNEERVSYLDHQFIHPDDVELYRSVLLDADKKRVGYDVRCRIFTSSGALRHVREISQPVLNEHGQIVRSIGATQDITEYVEIEMALRESEQRYRRLLDQSSDLMAVCKPDGARIFVNKAYCEFTGKPEHELLKGKAGDMYSPRDYKKFRDSLQALTPKRPSVECEYAMVRHDGKQRILLWNDYGYFDQNGVLVESIATGRDISA